MEQTVNLKSGNLFQNYSLHLQAVLAFQVMYLFWESVSSTPQSSLRLTDRIKQDYVYLMSENDTWY